MTRAFFFAHYTAWALIWGHVLFYYGAFSHREWRARGGRWAHVPAYATALGRFTFAPLLGDALAKLHGRPLATEDTTYRFQKSNRIAFFIALGSLSYVLMGLTLSVFPDRTAWAWYYQVSLTVLVALTSIAGLGHLFTALEHQPRRWRWFVAAMLAWYPVAMWGFESLHLFS